MGALGETLPFIRVHYYYREHNIEYTIYVHDTDSLIFHGRIPLVIFQRYAYIMNTILSYTCLVPRILISQV